MDDVISTGGSLRAMEDLVALAGGTVVARIAVLAEGDAAKREDIRFLAPLPLFNADGCQVMPAAAVFASNGNQYLLFHTKAPFLLSINQWKR